VLSGSLTLRDKASGKTLVVHQGQSVGESVDDVHRGESGDEPTVLLITYAGTPGVPTSVPAEGEKALDDVMVRKGVPIPSFEVLTAQHSTGMVRTRFHDDRFEDTRQSEDRSALPSEAAVVTRRNVFLRMLTLVAASPMSG
jgi:hypothetical protein